MIIGDTDEPSCTYKKLISDCFCQKHWSREIWSISIVITSL